MFCNYRKRRDHTDDRCGDRHLYFQPNRTEARYNNDQRLTFVVEKASQESLSDDYVVCRFFITDKSAP